jgi:hypothetical protein
LDKSAETASKLGGGAVFHAFDVEVADEIGVGSEHTAGGMPAPVHEQDNV